MPLDRFQREIDYLRISLTDHCNLRCVYCMPIESPSYTPAEKVLTPAQIERVAQAAASVGFRRIRLTGGEPTLRPDLVEIVERIGRIEAIQDIAMTTNGILLPRLAGRLRQAGLRRVNIHLDSLRPESVTRVMRWGSFADIWAGIEAAVQAGLSPLKINCVVTLGFNEADVVELAELTLERDWHVRFIELMPLGGGECARLAETRWVSNAETRRRIEGSLGALAPLPVANASDESKNYRLPNGRGVIGFISPVSEPYCGTCNRMRLTSDGRFHLCLLNDDEIDVAAALRRESSITDIGATLLRAVAQKPTGHALHLGRSTEERSMYHLGG